MSILEFTMIILKGAKRTNEQISLTNAPSELCLLQKIKVLISHGTETLRKLAYERVSDFQAYKLACSPTTSG